MVWPPLPSLSGSGALAPAGDIFTDCHGKGAVVKSAESALFLTFQRFSDILQHFK